jgi:hypothetical protein
MNGRSTDEDAMPVERIAAVARSLQLKHDPHSRTPDYADYVAGMRVYVKKELILARIDEARICGGLAMTARIAELAILLAECEKAIPAESRWVGGTRRR